MRPILLGGAAAAGLALVVYAVFGGVALVNYDTLYMVVWGRDLASGVQPQLELALAPTPHPLLEVLAMPLAWLTSPPEFGQGAVVAGAYLSLGAVGVLVYALGAAWFGRTAGVIAAAIVLTREPVLSFGVRAYADLPYLALLLGALLVETRRPRAGWPVLALLAVAGLIRPEAWLFSAAYWVYLVWRGGLDRGQLAGLAAVAASAPVLWGLHDLLLTGDPLWSLTGTRESAQTLGRKTGLDDVPVTMPRRIGEILREPVLVGAAGGGILTLAWLRDRARLPAVAGVLGAAAFVVLAGAGLSILARYLIPVSAILAIFCGAGLAGWTLLSPDDHRRRPWMAFAAVCVLLFVVFAPSQVRRIDRLQSALARQERIVTDLHELRVGGPDSCGPLAVPNRRPVPYIALWTGGQPSEVRVAAVSGVPPRATYYVPLTAAIADDFILDAKDRDRRVVPPPRTLEPVAANRSWREYSCPPGS